MDESAATPVDRLADALLAAGPLLGAATPDELAGALGWRTVGRSAAEIVGGPVPVAVALAGDPVTRAQVRLTGPDVPAGDAGYEMLVDGFADAVDRLGGRFPWTFGERAGPRAMVAWEAREPTRRGLLRRRRRFALSVEVTPAPSVDLAVRSMDEVAHLHVPASPALADDAAVLRPAWRDGDWTAFAGALALELADLATDEFIILSDAADPESFVQVIQHVGNAGWALRAEAINNYDGVPARELSQDRQRALAELGWRRSDDAGIWGFDLEWPPHWSGYRRVVAVLVGALRDVFGVASPADLVLDGSAKDPRRLA